MLDLKIEGATIFDGDGGAPWPVVCGTVAGRGAYCASAAAGHACSPPNTTPHKLRNRQAENPAFFDVRVSFFA